MRANPTPAERTLWALLRNRQFGTIKFRRQHPIGRYIADFSCLSHRLVIELDGSGHVDSLTDRVRDEWLAAEGWQVLRFWNADVLFQPDLVKDRIWYALTVEATSLTRSADALRPLPEGEVLDSPTSPACGRGRDAKRRG